MLGDFFQKGQRSHAQKIKSKNEREHFRESQISHFYVNHGTVSVPFCFILFPAIPPSLPRPPHECGCVGMRFRPQTGGTVYNISRSVIAPPPPPTSRLLWAQGVSRRLTALDCIFHTSIMLGKEISPETLKGTG